MIFRNSQFIINIRAALATAMYFIWICIASIAILQVLLLVLSIACTSQNYNEIFRTESLICHQIPERSYIILGRQLPICARCFGLYLGVLISGIVYFFRNDLPKEITLHSWFWFIAFFDITLKAIEIDMFNHWRMLSGLCLGALLFCLPFIFIQYLLAIPQLEKVLLMD